MTLDIIKDSPLINSGLLVNFLANEMDTANYHCNWLSIKRSGLIIISKKAWTNTRQNLEHICIFESKISTFILNKKRIKSDIRKTWKRIFIDYTKISKYLRVWTPHIYQILIARKPVVNDGKKDADLFVKYLLLLQKSFWPETGEPKPKVQLYKISIVKSSKDDETGKKTCTTEVATKDGNIDNSA